MEEENRQKNRGFGRWWFLAGLLAGMLIMVPAALAMGHNGRLAGYQEAVSGGKGYAKIPLVEEYIRTYYLESEDIEEGQLETGAAKGMMKALNDPYSEYYTEEEYNSLLEQTSGVYGGIGAYISLDKDTGIPMISGVFDDSPAARAGLVAGDLIYEVDGTDSTRMTTSEVVALVKGPEGTTVIMKVLREGKTDLLEVEVDREIINAPTVNAEMLDERIGYLQITQFDTVTPDQFSEALEDLKSRGMQGMVLDLRGNPGGVVGAVNSVAGFLLPEGLVFYSVDRDGNRTEYTCPGADFDLPLAVLIDKGSASASEILSGAIQDAGIGTLVGTRSYGKGVVQSLYQLEDGTGMKITVAKYFTRGGQDINKVGITPDVEAELDTEAYTEYGIDSQLDAAIGVVEEKLGR